MAKLTKQQIMELGNPYKRSLYVTYHQTKDFTIVVYFGNGVSTSDPIANGTHAFPIFYVDYMGRRYRVLVDAYNERISDAYAHFHFLNPVAPCRSSFIQRYQKDMSNGGRDNWVDEDKSFGPQAVYNSIADFVGYFYWGDRYIAKYM